MKNISIADTHEAREAFKKYKHHIEAAAQRYPVVIGPSGVVFYDPREFSPHASL